MKTDYARFAALCISLTVASAECVLAEDAKTDASQGGSNSQSTSAAGVAKSDVQDGIARMGTKVFFIKNGRATVIDNELKLSEGITVRPNGEVEWRDGRKLQLEDQQLVTLKGELKKLPPNANLQQHTGTTSTTGQSTQGAITNPIRPTPAGQGGEISLGGTGPDAARDKSFEQKGAGKVGEKKAEAKP